jgi:hypothetical protein
MRVLALALAACWRSLPPTVRPSLQSAARASRIQIGNTIKEQRGAAVAAPIVIAAPGTNILQTIERLPFGASPMRPASAGLTICCGINGDVTEDGLSDPSAGSINS